MCPFLQWLYFIQFSSIPFDEESNTLIPLSVFRFQVTSIPNRVAEIQAIEITVGYQKLA